MMTEETFQRLLAFADAEIARTVEVLRMQAGRGLSIDDGVVSVQPGYLPRDQGGEEELSEIPARYASDLFLELVGLNLYVNLPPIYGVEVTLDGDGLYSQPRPFFELAETHAHKVLVRIDYEREGVVLTSQDGLGTLTAGLVTTNLTCAVILEAIDFIPENLSPTEGVGELGPYPGTYRQWLSLGTVEDGVVSMYPAIFPASTGWGGTHQVTLPEFGESTWTFLTGTTYP